MFEDYMYWYAAPLQIFMYICIHIHVDYTIEHVNNIPTMQSFHCNFQKYSVKIIYAIIDWMCLEFPK